MQALGQNPTEEQIQHMMNEIDENNDGQVSYDEFICLICKVLREERNLPEELKEVFRAFDEDKDDMISAEDLNASFKRLGYQLQPDEASKMIKLFDKDNDNALSFQEFIQMMMFDPNDPLIPYSAE